MLKIKDNVDLKELEKYGFEKDIFGGYTKIRRIEETIVYTMRITPTNRYLQINLFDRAIIASSLQTTIYDLIQDGLIEKVEKVEKKNELFI